MLNLNSGGKVMRKLFLLIFFLLALNSLAHSQGSPSSTSFISGFSLVQLFTERNYFDLQSNGTPLQIWQDIAHPDLLHAVYTISSEQTGWNDRQVYYFFSTDGGTNWESGEPVEFGTVSDFASISGDYTGKAVICANTYTAGINRTQIYEQTINGFNYFIPINPGGATNKFLWPRVTAASGSINAYKYVFLTSSMTDDSVFYNVRSVDGSFRGYKPLNAKPGECYTISNSTAGIIGITYISKQSSPAEYGDIYFIESTNNGNTFTSPLKIYDANFSTDSLAAFKGISMTYTGSQAKVVFETVKQKTDGSYFPEAPSKIRYWATNLPGTDPNRSVVIADSSNVPYASAKGTLDFEAPICRPSIGVSGNYVFCTYMVQTPQLGGSNNTSFNTIYLSISSNGGQTWYTPRRLSLSTSYDWSAASISPVNLFQSGGINKYTANMIIQRDVVPGSNISTNNPNTDAKAFFAKLEYLVHNPPVLLSPANNSTNVSLTPLFTFQTGSEYFTLEISLVPDFSTVVYRGYGDFTYNGQLQLPASSLNINTTYYWRVMGDGQGIGGQWSNVFKFTTGTSGIVQNSGEIPTKYDIYPNYPNPFNPTTKIIYDLPVSSRVSIKVFDSGGREVEQLVNMMQSAGSYTVDFNGSSLSSGIYFYTINSEGQNQSFTKTMKMVLVK